MLLRFIAFAMPENDTMCDVVREMSCLQLQWMILIAKLMYTVSQKSSHLWTLCNFVKS